MSTLRDNFPSAFDRNVTKDILDAFANTETFHDKVFDVRGSGRKSEKVSAHAPFGAMPLHKEGEKWATDDSKQRFTYELTHNTYALAFKVSPEMVEDDEINLVGRLAASLGRSAAETINVTAANIFNRAFNSSFTYGDAKELCATDHATEGGTEQNELTTAADLSNASLDEALYVMQNTVDHRGKMLNIQANRLVVPSALGRTADQILNSQYEYNATSGALNKNVYQGRLIPVEIPYLTDTDAWFLLAPGNGLVFYDRVSYDAKSYIEDETESLVHYGRMRFSVGAEDWRGVFGTPGAA